MKLRLVKDARVSLKAGEIVEVSPEVANYLLSTRQAEVLRTAAHEAPEAAIPRQTRTTTKAKAGKK